MSLIRPSFAENLVTSLFALDPSRPQYYLLVYRLTKNIFITLGFDGSNPDFEDKVTELDTKIRNIIEIPLEARFVSVVAAFDSPRFFMSKKAFTFIGDGVDQHEVTRYEIQLRLDAIRGYCYDSVSQMSQYIRFTRPAQVMM